MKEFFNQAFSSEAFQGFEAGEYDQCRFTGLDLSSADLSRSQFLECRFERCNLSMTSLTESVLSDVVFEECKLLGLRFDSVSRKSIQASFHNCILDHSVFEGVKLAGVAWRHCRLHGVDFTGASLQKAVFDHCDLTDAQFEGTDLTGADLRGSIHYALDPEKNRLREARFSLPEVVGLLAKYKIRID